MPHETFLFHRTALALAISLACASGPSWAATLNIGGGCTLINAIHNANDDVDTDGVKGCPAGSGADTINLPERKTYWLAVVDNYTDGANGLPSVTSDITINGNDSKLIRINTIKEPHFRILHIAATGKLALNSITISNGSLRKNDERDFGDGGGLLNRGEVTMKSSRVSANSADGGNGGGIANLGTLALINTTVSNNRTGFYYAAGKLGGGGIANAGVMTLTNSTVSGNTADGFDSDYYGHVGGIAGGINNSGKAVLKNSTVSGNSSYFGGGGLINKGTISVINSTVSDNNTRDNGGGLLNSGTISLINSTVSNNRGEGGGGLFNSGTTSLTNSTVSNNSAGFNGGGVANYGTISLINSTLSNNSGYLYGGGLSNWSTASLKNTIIANSRGEAAGDCYSSGTMQLSGVNLIEDGSCGAPLSGDPKLGTLKDNGGSTRTHALLAGSPAIDAGRCSTLTDQRGVSRPQPVGGQCDIGAYEHIPVGSDSVSPTVWDIVDFLTVQIAGGGINGTGHQVVQRQLAALNQLTAAGNYRDRALNARACDQLARLLQRIDPDNTPDNSDYLTGTEADALAEKITALLSSWSCP